MSNLQKLRTIGSRAHSAKWYTDFCVLYDTDKAAASKFLKASSVFVKLRPYIDYYDGKSGSAVKSIEMFALRNPEIKNECSVCGKETRWAPVLHRWNATCGYSCGALACEPKRKKTNLKKYCVSNAGGAECAKRRRTKTILKKYGVRNAFQSATLMKKAKTTLKKKYGVSNPSKSSIVKERKRQTMLKNFGVDHWTQNKEHFEKHGCPWDAARLSKARNTCIARYGTANPAQHPTVQARMKATSLKRYGVENPGCLPQYENYKVYTDNRNVKHIVVGYEHHALRMFDKKHNVIRLESRSSHLPRISYRENDKIRKYYPDFAVYTSETRTLVEVKSSYTLCIDIENLARKCKAATRFMQKRGWNFQLVLVNAQKKYVRICNNPMTVEDIVKSFSKYLPERFANRLGQ